MEPISVLATVTGRDRPGVVAAFFAALAAHDVDVRDVEQVVIRERLVLTVLFDARGDMAALRNSVTTTAAALGMECQVAVAGDGGPARREAPGARHNVTVLGQPLRPGAVSHVAQRIADSGGNIEAVAQLAAPHAVALELTVRSTDAGKLREELVRAAAECGVDIAVEPTQLRRRAKRLVLLDAHSTLLLSDALDRGELVLTPDAGTFVQALRRLGYRVGAVTGGGARVVERLRTELDLDFAAAVEADNANALRRFAQECAVPMSQTVAVGDGPDDVDLISAAGLGIAFNSARAMRAVENDRDVTYLDSILFVLGVTGAEPDETGQ